MTDYPPPPQNQPGAQPPGWPGAQTPAGWPGGQTPAGGPPPQPGTGGYGQPPAYPPGSNTLQAGDGSFFAALFDFSFSQFVTPKIVKLV